MYRTTKSMMLSLRLSSLLLIAVLALSCLSGATTTFVEEQNNNEVVAQPYLQTINYRNLSIDLGNGGLKTNAQLTLPAVGNGPFPGVLLVHGGGPTDMNYTQGFVSIDNKSGAKVYPPTFLFQIAEYLSERGFAVLRYDKRGIGANHTILDSNVWGNVTFNDLKQDAEKALAVLAQQPEVDPNRITIIGHSEGGVITSRVALDNPDIVKNIVLMGTSALNLIKDSAYVTYVHLPIIYAQNVLDKNHSGLVSVKEASEDPVFQGMVLDNSTLFIGHSNITGIDSAVNETKSANDTKISINNELKPRLERQFEQYINELNSNTNQSRILDKKCSFDIFSCPMWAKSHLLLTDTLSVIGNVSSNIGILTLMGENDLVQHAFLLQQRLTEVNHPDHTLITYPNLGHHFYPENIWQTGVPVVPEPISEYVLADLYSWLEAHSGMTSSHSSALIANSSNSSTYVTPSSASGK
jgi:pimeloyl-ACP methyl ester carboxylesterase